MTINKLDHYSVRTDNLARAVVFYENVLGFRTGPRPPFKFPGSWLYHTDHAGCITGSSVVHLIGIDPHDSAGLTDYLGDKPHSVQAGSGALDHIAFVASDIHALYARLSAHQIGFRERKVPDMALHQIFIDDPDGVTIELNYSGQEDIAAGKQHMLPAVA